MTNKTKVYGQKIGCDMGIYKAPPVKLTKKEFAYHFAGQAAKDFAQGFQMLLLSLRHYDSHLRNLAIGYLHHGHHLVLGLLQQRARKSFESPVIDKIETSNVQIEGRPASGLSRSNAGLDTGKD